VAQLRVPPHAVEAEQAVLGALIADKTALQVVADVLSPADFFRREHLVIYAAIRAIAARNEPVDVVTLFEELDGEPLDYGGLQYLNALASSMTSAANVRRYAELVRDRALLRRLIAAADEAATAAFTGKAGSAPQIIETALEQVRAIAATSAGGRGPPVLGLEQLQAHAEGVSWLVKGVIPADSIGVVFGGSGTFKSFVTLDLALHVAHGLPWLGRKTVRGPVLFLAAEGGAGIWRRIEAWHKARRLDWRDAPVYVVPVALDLGCDCGRLRGAVEAAGVTPCLVAIDTLSQTFAGEENSANEVAAWMREIGSTIRAAWRCAVAVLHHSGHQATERPRGSSAIRANVDWMYGVFRDEKEMLATMVSVKQKDGDAVPDATFSLIPQQLGRDHDGDAITSLVARHLSSAEEVVRAAAGERAAGRGGKNQRLLELVQNGMREAELRKLFDDACEEMSAEARRQAWFRARKWAITNGVFDIAQGIVVTLKRDARP
jgi:hypothetical protein